MLEGFDTSNVLIVGPSYKDHRGGIGSVIDSYSKEFTVFNFYSTYKSINKFIVPFYSFLKLSYFPFYLLFKRKIKIVHIHGASRGSFFRKFYIYFISKFIFRKKVIYHIHGGEFHTFYSKSNILLKYLIRHFINAADTIICLSKSWERYFSSNFKPIRIEVVPNFIIKKEPVQYRAHETKVVFLFLGKLVAAKGVYDLVEVAKEMSISYQDAFELWIGGNGDSEKLEQLISKNNLRQNVKYLGWVSGAKKEAVFQSANVFILPSYNEGMPVSILEAMSYGLPIISTFVGGIPEVVEEYESGILILPGDTEKLKIALQTFIKNKGLIKEMGSKSFEIIEKNYTAEVALLKLNNTYQQLL